MTNRQDKLGVSLWIKLTGIFAAVIVVGVAVTVVLARQGAATQITHFMVGNNMVLPSSLQTELVDYYAGRGSWAGVEEALPQMVGAAGFGAMGGMMGQMMGMFDGRIAVWDGAGRLVAAIGPRGSNASAVEQGWPLLHQGERIGTLVIEGASMTMEQGADGQFLSQLTRAVVIAALVAGLVALALGILLIRQITRPLAELGRASRRIAAGERAVQVEPSSGDEIGQLARTFNQMASALDRQETLRRNLMTDVAHELRTPLAGIQGTVEAMQDGVFPLTSDNLGSIHEQVAMLNRLVEDLRTLAHMEADQLSLQLQELDLAQTAASIVAAQQSIAVRKGVEMAFETNGEMPTVRADSERIGQVILNLISNAVRHTQAGGRVSVRLSAADGGVVLSVEDNGEGIPADALPRVFERLYRSDSSRSRQSGGSGLGLAIAQRLVEAHGGRIWAESPPPGSSKGTRFSVFLPAQGSG